ncbi:MAG: putative phage protein [Schlesneria sp.]|nr:putative phage protein [Schlesneria sp.]
MTPLRFRAWQHEFKKMYEVWQVYIGQQGGFMGRAKDGEVRQQVGLADTFVLMQYTGLTDKNGVEIFEGDVVVFEAKRYEPFRVEYSQFYAGFIGLNQFNNQSPELAKWCRCKDIEVIGNIYQNPDLLPSNA